MRALPLLVLLAFVPSFVVAHPWSPGPAAPPGLGTRSTAGTYDGARQVVVVFGGTNGALQDDTWEFDGTGWSQGPTAPAGLTARTGHAMVFDYSRSSVLLFGGNDGAVKRDVWSYDGAAWTQDPNPPGALVARAEAAMSYDLRRGVVVLFGGDTSGTGTGLLDDTWEHGTLGWTQGPAAPAGLTARSAHAMAYHFGSGKVVLFGGFDGAVKGDTWLYDGAWSAGQTAPGLAARSGHGMTWESSPDRVLLFGGFDGTSYVSDSWEFDGVTWVGGNSAPPNLEPRFAPVVTYDPVRGLAVVFGGFDGSAPYFSDTWVYAAYEHYLVGAGAGPSNPNQVKTFESDGSAGGLDFLAYGAGAWGVNVAAGSVDAGSREEILTGPGPGPIFGPQVRGFQADATPMGKINFFAYGTLKYGVGVTVPGTDADAFREIVTGAGPGEVFGPHVRGFNFDATSVQPIAKVNFFAYSTLKYGVNTGGGDVDADGFDEIATGPGPGAIFGPIVRGFNVDGGAATSIAKINFSAFTAQQFGANVAAGFVDVDSYAEIGAAPGAGPALGDRFRGFDYDGTGVAPIAGIDFQAFGTLYGGRIGFGDIASGAKVDLLVSPGPSSAAPGGVQAHRWDGTALQQVGSFDAFPGSAYGANVTGHVCGM